MDFSYHLYVLSWLRSVWFFIHHEAHEGHEEIECFNFLTSCTSWFKLFFPFSVVLPPPGRREPGHWPSESARLESSHPRRAISQALQLFPFRPRARGCRLRGFESGISTASGACPRTI